VLCLGTFDFKFMISWIAVERASYLKHKVI